MIFLCFWVYKNAIQVCNGKLILSLKKTVFISSWKTASVSLNQYCICFNWNNPLCHTKAVLSISKHFLVSLAYNHSLCLVQWSTLLCVANRGFQRRREWYWIHFLFRLWSSTYIRSDPSFFFTTIKGNDQGYCDLSIVILLRMYCLVDYLTFI